MVLEKDEGPGKIFAVVIVLIEMTVFNSGQKSTSSLEQLDDDYMSSEAEVQILRSSAFKKDDDTADTYFSAQIEIPDGDGENYSFSWRKLWLFTGPGFLMSIAYLDPGNIESDLQSGVIARYRLLWLLSLATLFGLFVQIISARIGTVTGLHMAELCYVKFHKVPRLLLWITTEIAIIGSDMQEVIGTAIAIFLLSNGRVPIWAGVCITILDTFTFLFLDKYGLRKLEAFFGSLITIMAVSFGYEFFKVGPEFGAIGLGLVFPYCKRCSSDALPKAVGIIGAIIMPHNLYLHSALVKSRKIDRRNVKKVKEANKYVAIESAIALLVSLIINIMVTAVFAHGMNGKKNNEIRKTCLSNPSINSSVIFSEEALKAFPDDQESIDADLFKAGIFLGCAFGLPALYVWAVGIFAAGQSSTMTGTYAGQFVMEGFLDLHWSRWKRVLLTRALAIAPTLSLAVSVNSIQDLTGMNDLLNVLMSLMLPFALLPLIIFSSSEKVMQEFKTSKIAQVVLWFLSTAVIGINLTFVSIYVNKNLPGTWYVYLLLVIFVFFYMSFIVFLIGCLLVVLGKTFVLKTPFLGRYMTDDYVLHLVHHSSSHNEISNSESTVTGSSPVNYSSINN
jgi:natural resistance-associated macrophage protein